MIAVTAKPAQETIDSEAIVLHGIKWDTFEAILDDIGETRPYRMSYDDGDLEFMTISFGHEHWCQWIGRLIFFLAVALQVPICSGGSTTLKYRLRKKGLEPDDCVWVKHAEKMRGKKEWRAKKSPPPDLAVEIDVTSSSLNRLAIYAALQVPEVWRFDGKTLTVLVLGANDEYKAKAKSLSFPWLPLSEFVPFITKLENEGEMPLFRSYMDWLRATVAPAAPEKNRGK